MANTTLVLVGVIILMLIGIMGTIVPLLPGVPLVFVAICAYGWYEGFSVITPKLIVFFATLTILSMFVTYLAAALGVKQFGSSKYGIWGALLGTIIGIIIFPPLGILIGPWIGAFIGEYIHLHDVNKSVKAGLGAVVGLISGLAFELLIALVMAIWFLVIVF